MHTVCHGLFIFGLHHASIYLLTESLLVARLSNLVQTSLTSSTFIQFKSIFKINYHLFKQLLTVTVDYLHFIYTFMIIVLFLTSKSKLNHIQMTFNIVHV